MSRFVIANRRAGKFTAAEKTMARLALDANFPAIQPSVNVLNDTQPSDPEKRRIIVLDADPAEMRSWAQQLPEDVIVEPEILHRPITSFAVAPLHLLELQRKTIVAPFLVGAGLTLTVAIKGNGQPLEGAEIILFLRGMGGFSQRLEARTGADGQLTFSYGWFFRPAAGSSGRQS